MLMSDGGGGEGTCFVMVCCEVGNAHITSHLPFFAWIINGRRL
jgi:hypothetical protein